MALPLRRMVGQRVRRRQRQQRLEQALPRLLRDAHLRRGEEHAGDGEGLLAQPAVHPQAAEGSGTQAH